MNHLDNPALFNAALIFAVNLGIIHSAKKIKRLKTRELLEHVARELRLSELQSRNFHNETLNRAYGLAFTNAAHMAEGRKNGWIP